jgi:hypothetical protein
MTPHELNLRIQVYNEENLEKGEEELVIAYLTAYWNRVRRMPNLKNILSSIRPREEMSDEQLLAQIKAMNAAMGGKVQIKRQE